MNIVFKYFIIINIFISSLYANVYINSPKEYISGDAVVFSIDAIGSDITIPEIKRIGDYVVEQVASSRSITSINGNLNSKITQKYRFFPLNDITIPSFTVNIDGKKYFTEEQSIKKIKVKKTDSHLFDLTISMDKNSLYVGEQSELKLIFKYKKDLEIVDLSFSMPSFENFWSKQLDTSKKYEDQDYIYQKLSFLLFPQKSGLLNIPSVKIGVKILDLERSRLSIFGNATKNLKIYSNDLSINVKSLPENIKLVGNFLLDTSISQNEIDAGESISYKININGSGNIDDIDDFKLDIPNVTIYENKPILKSEYTSAQSKNSYQKSFSILANEDFVIPSIEFKYFDINTKKTVIKKSKEYKIKVKKIENNISNTLQKSNKEVIKTKEIIIYKNSLQDKILFFIFGMLSAILIFCLYYYVTNKAKKIIDDLPLVKLIKNSKTKDDLIKILLPYLGLNTSLDNILFELEKDLNIDLKIKKKILIEIVESLNIEKGLL